jgi:hypothetical protein
MSEAPEVIWKPQPGSQEEFLRCPIFEVLYEGTRGPGKTDALLMDFGQFVGRGHGPAWRGILFRQTFPQLTDVISKTKKWFPQIWPDVSFNGSMHTWTWKTGEQLLLRQFNRDDDYWNFHGHEYPWVGWEELCNWPTPSGYKRMMSVCRSPDAKVPRHYRATTNPYGPGHNWVKQRWRLPQHRSRIIWDATDEEGHKEPPRVAIHGFLDENQVLLKADPDYKDRLRASARNEAEMRAWMEGDWDIVAGGMFDDVWARPIHVIPAFTIPHSWRIDRSFDWGSSKPFSVGWWAESDGSDVQLPSGAIISTVPGDTFRIAEWYGWNKQPNEGLRMLATEVAYGIVEREVKWGIHGRVEGGPADTSIFTTENGSCIADDMEAPVRLPNGQVHAGVYWTRADKSPGSRKMGWEMVRKMLKQAIPEKNRPREKPGLFVFSTCEQFIRTVPVLPRDGRDIDDVDSKAEDHIADETRYRVRDISNQISSGTTVGMY